MFIYWNKIPAKYKFVAIDKDRTVYAYSAPPIKLDNAWTIVDGDWIELDDDCYKYHDGDNWNITIPRNFRQAVKA